MATWNDLPVAFVAGDTKTGTAGLIGTEQFFQTQATLPVGILSSPRKFRLRLHKSLTSTGGTLVNTVLTACSLRFRVIAAPTLAIAQAGGGTVLGDTGAFNLVGSLLGMVNAQIYMHQKVQLKASGAAGKSVVNGQGVGQVYPASGVPAIGLSMPLGADLNTLDCTVPQQIFVGVTFAVIAGANSVTLNSMTCQYTD